MTFTPPTDEKLADSLPKTRYWRSNRQYMRHWEIPMFVREALREKGLDKNLGDPTLFENTVQRVTHLIRSRRSKRGAKKRRKTLLRKKQFELFA